MNNKIQGIKLSSKNKAISVFLRLLAIALCVTAFFIGAPVLFESDTDAIDGKWQYYVNSEVVLEFDFDGDRKICTITSKENNVPATIINCGFELKEGKIDFIYDTIPLNKQISSGEYSFSDGNLVLTDADSGETRTFVRPSDFEKGSSGVVTLILAIIPLAAAGVLFKISSNVSVEHIKDVPPAPHTATESDTSHITFPNAVSSETDEYVPIFEKTPEPQPTEKNKSNS